MKLNICHLYPDLMDTYGDKGNIVTITKRCAWRGIETSVDFATIDQDLDSEKYDIYFFGGGQDIQQSIVSRDLTKKEKKLKQAIEEDAVLLSICGGYQLLQNYFKTHTGETIPGIGLFDAYTIASHDRMIQNLLIKINPDLQEQISQSYPAHRLTDSPSHRFTGSPIHRPTDSPSHRPTDSTDLIGFENHSGKTYLGKGLQPLGTVLKGAGNNGQDQTEGAVYKNAFGCYLHGSLLPKNPHFADFLITKALERKNGKVKLKPLDDSIEWQAHASAVERAKND